MKKLFLVRHAKSSWGNSGVSDRFRDLNKRGKRDAPRMGDRLAARDVAIDRMITSPATRALKTAEIFTSALDFPGDELIIDERLYHADVEEILSIVYETPNYLNQIMLFGHNPGMTDLVNSLCLNYLDNLPTCGIFEFGYKIKNWSQIEDVAPENTILDYPKND